MEENIHNKKRSMAGWKNFIGYLKPYKKDFIKLAIYMVVLGIIDSIFPLLNKYAIDNFVASSSMKNLKNFSLKYILSILLLSLTVFSFIKTAGRIETNMAYDIRKLGFQKLQKLSLSYYDKNAAGWIMSRMTSDINRLTEIISWGLLDIAWGLSLMTAISISMFRLNVRLALVTLALVPLLIIISIFFQKRILSGQRKIRKINSKITASYNEDIQGAKTTKTLGREELNLQEFSKLTSNMKEESIRAIIISSIYIPLVLIIGSIASALVISIGGREVLRSSISYGTLMAFIAYASQFFEPINQIALVFAELQTAQASAERIFELLNEKEDIVDSPDVVELYGDLLNPKKDKWPRLEGNIEFRNVDFIYEGQELIIDQLQLKVKKGETIALVGETGSGKSTIVNLLCRFYEPSSGQILIDDRDYRTLPQNWIHENLGYVLQTPQLFTGTVRDNLLYGRPDISEEKMIETCKLLNCHDLIMSMDKAYDSDVGQSGNLLSTGEKQLISFARAILRDPAIFVLDEATSSIDTETERRIQEAIEKSLKGRTSFIIAHRLSTIKNADRILVIKKGRILEEGSHEDLLKKNGYYKKLYDNQFIEDKRNKAFTSN